MGLMARDNGGGDFKKLPPGAHFAICNAVVDVGMQEGYSGKPQHKVYIRWEVPDERVEYAKDGVQHEGPMAIGRFYTLSLSEKAALRADLESWRGRTFTDEELKGFDLKNLLGKTCQLMVVHAEANGKTYANVKGIMGVSKDQRERAKAAKPENPLLFFALNDDESAYDLLPEWLRKKIAERIEPASQEARTTQAPGADEMEFSDDIPFAWATLIPLGGFLAYAASAAQSLL